MRKKLAGQGIIKMICGIVILGLLLFLPARTFRFPGAWRMLGILFIPMLTLGTVLLIARLELLVKRLNQRETEAEQKMVILFSMLLFFAVFLLCSFGFRFGWSRVSNWLTYLGCAVFLLTYLGFAELLRENEYLSRTVEVQEGQMVVSTGLYGIVRHPMYAIIFWMFLSMPIIVESFVGMVPMLFLPVIFAKRIRNEEELLKRELDGYDDYMERVRYRILPYIW